MAIADEILARSPVLYWKLDESSGPAASDSSGHGHPGVYGGPFTLRQYGPVVGEYAVQFAATGSVTCTSFPQIMTAGFSVVWYMSYNVLTTPTDVIFISHAGSGLSPQRGWEVHLFSGDQFNIKCWPGSGTVINPTATNMVVWQRWWHAWCLTFSPNTYALWIDGVQRATATLTNTGNSILSTDTFGINTGYPAVVAHLAYFDHVLSSTDIGAIGGFRYDWPFGPLVNVTWPSPPSGAGGALDPSDPVVIDINTDLSDIRGAVLHDYTTGPP